MKLTEMMVRRPVSAVVVIIGIILFGVFSIFGMPQELTPEMNIPVLIINAVYPGAGPADVEKLVSKKIEGAVTSLTGIRDVSSYSMENVSLGILQYEYGTDMKTAYNNVKERLDSIANDLPDDALQPVIIEMDMNAMDTMTLSVRSSSGENLLGRIEDDIIPEFEKLSAVADVGVSGGREEYIRVELLEEKLNQYGVTMSTVTNSVSTADFSLPSGTAGYGSQSLSVRSSVEFDTISALENIPIPLGSGNIIRLADVANVYAATKDAESISRYDGESNISLGIQKRQSESAVTTSRQVREAIEELNAKESDLHIDIVNDNSDSIQDSIKTVGSTLVLAIALSMIVLFLFLGDIKASLIIASSMPVSLLITFILMYFMGFTLNVVTMSAMVLGVGMMVDNSIVVLDSCIKSSSGNKGFVESAIAGTKFVFNAIIGLTLTTIIVFLPLATLQGMSGQLFRPLGYTIIFALAASLLSAITLVPLFFVQYKPREKQDVPAAKLLKKIERGYAALLRRILNRKWTAGLVSIALVGVSLILATKINMELMPATDQGVIDIAVETRPGLHIEKIDEIMANIEGIVSKHPDVEHYTITAGGSGLSMMMSGGGSNSATVYLKSDRAMATADIIEQFRVETKDIQNCDISVSSQSMTMSMSNDNIEINLQGNDFDILKAFIGDIEGTMKEHPGVISVTSSIADPTPQAEIVVDPMKAAAVGLTPMQVASTVRMALNGADTVDFMQHNREYKIRVEYPKGKYETVGDLSKLMLVSPTGTSVPLMDIATIIFTDIPQTIIRTNGQYQVTVTGTPTEADRFTAKAEVTAQIGEMRFPDGVSIVESSQQESMMEEFTALGMAILAAIWLVFMLMAIQFESIRHSLMVMICIPFSMIGAFALMYITGTTISMTSLLGFLILIGTVINSGILFVDSANQFRKSMDLHTALVYTGQNRLRPILMTTMTTVLSMLPLCFASGSAAMMKGLGMVVIGGLSVSTVMTLLLLPTFYLIIDGDEDKRNKRIEKKRQKREAKEAAKRAKEQAKKPKPPVPQHQTDSQPTDPMFD